MIGALVMLGAGISLLSWAVRFWSQRKDSSEARALIERVLGEIAFYDRYCASFPQVVLAFDLVRKMLADSECENADEFRKELKIARHKEFVVQICTEGGCR
ncbi:MAG: hypothetical protein PHV85_00225 [Desulfovibrionaceae bacterium]|nr:hypothetical protein [Desulfovibrionaceae bacterium]